MERGVSVQGSAHEQEQEERRANLGEWDDRGRGRSNIIYPKYELESEKR